MSGGQELPAFGNICVVAPALVIRVRIFAGHGLARRICSGKPRLMIKHCLYDMFFFSVYTAIGAIV